MPHAPVNIWNTDRTIKDAARVVEWKSLKTHDDAEAYSVAAFSDAVLQIDGVFGVRAEVVILGSNDGTRFTRLSDNLGNGMAFNTARIVSVSCPPRFIKPSIPTGDETTDITVTMLMRRSK